MATARDDGSGTALVSAFADAVAVPAVLPKLLRQMA
jgi:hypothetical protein